MEHNENQLDTKMWRQLARLWATLAAVPVSKPDQAVETLWSQLANFVDFDHAYMIVARRADAHKQPDPLAFFTGWEIAQFFYEPSSAPGAPDGPGSDIAWYVREYTPQDTWVQHFVETSGEHRTFIREDVLGDQPWSSCVHGKFMEHMGLSDRMHAAHALTETVEVFLCLDRAELPAFTPRDRQVMHEINLGLGPFWARLAMSFGLYEHQTALTPRLRETLLHLLDGYSEAEIAELMGLTPASAHQYVVKVFRALNVSSRAELMATWMGDLGVKSALV